MNLDQRNRLLTLAHEAAMLIVELQTDRKTSSDKARIRGVLQHLEAAHASLAKAVHRGEA